MEHSAHRTLAVLLIMLLTSLSPMLTLERGEDGAMLVEQRIEFDIIKADPDSISDWRPQRLDDVEVRQRPSQAWTRIGTFSADGFEPSISIPEELMATRSDLRMLIIEGGTPVSTARALLDEIAGLVVREYIWPSGLIIQGSHSSLLAAEEIGAVDSHHALPLALLLGDALLDLVLAGDDQTFGQTLLRVDGWRRADGTGFHTSIELTGPAGDRLSVDFSNVVRMEFAELIEWEPGRWDGRLAPASLAGFLAEPGLAWLRTSPVFGIYNNNAGSHMLLSQVATYFSTELNGSGQLIAVADTGIDHDHGDFGSRIDAKIDVINDGGKTGDKWSGHGTHVACTVLGDGNQGSYAGIAPEAELYFQAMEDDDDGSFYSPSLNYLFSAAYNAGARVHSNSWGSWSSSSQGEYTSESEDVDDAANTYDRYYNGYQGFSIVFAAGNDGPSSGTVNSPGTAKNSITVGMHQSRYSGAPNTIMSGSSRGPTDDGRIKPDILAPGGYIRSCKSQEATDTSGSTWENQYYIEYTGTSMATPNAAGAAALVREYLVEVAQRPAPQGALMKSMLILGAEDIGTRNIPNNDEGWGRINLRNSLAPSGGRGIWVDDRTSLNGGQNVEYTLNVTSSNYPFKVVLGWSDHYGSRFSTKQLVNDLDLEVEAPDGTIYLGNIFNNGRSTTGGSADDTNNVEVVLIDNAQLGIWKVRVADVQHDGPRAQMFAIAASGVGINDLRTDVAPTPGSLIKSVEIPQIGERIYLSYEIRNIGNAQANDFDVQMRVDGVILDTYRLSTLGPGGTTVVTWPWTPDSAGDKQVSVIVDVDDVLDESDENNNLLFEIISVTTPGVRLESPAPVVTLGDAAQTTAAWTVNLTNTALLETNASVAGSPPTQRSTGSQMPGWSLGYSSLNHSLQGQASVAIFVSLTIPGNQIPPAPGFYDILLTGFDVDNAVTFPFTITLEVPELPEALLSLPFSKIQVSPIETTTFELELFNRGNVMQGYDLYLESPTDWQAGFDDLGSFSGAQSGSSGTIPIDGSRGVNITMLPPVQLAAAGSEFMMTIRALAQDESGKEWSIDVEFVVESLEMVGIDLDMTLGVLLPDSRVNLAFVLENEGNTEVAATLDMVLPSGWILLQHERYFEFQPGDSVMVILPLQGNGYAQSGMMLLQVSSLSGENFIWQGELDVLNLPVPMVEFVDMRLGDGTLLNLSAGDEPPIGEMFEMRWVLTNAGSSDFDPILSIDAPSDWDSSCDQYQTLVPDQTETISCELIIPASEQAGTEVQLDFVVLIEDYEVRDTHSIVIPEALSLDWLVIVAPLMVVGQTDEVQIEVANDGNAKVSGRLTVDTPDSWTSEVQESRWLVLEPGESRRLRIEVTPGSSGTHTLIVGVEDSAVDGGSVTISIVVGGGPISADSAGGILSGAGIAALVFILLIGAGLAGVLIMSRGRSPPVPLLPPPPAVFGEGLGGPPPLPAGREPPQQSPPPALFQGFSLHPPAPRPGSLPSSKADPLGEEPSTPESPKGPAAPLSGAAMSPEASAKMERYIQQLVEGGYPEAEARQHALEHIDKF